MDLRVGLDDVEKRKFLTLQGLEFRPLGLPARSQSLYRLLYSGPDCFGTLINKYKLENKLRISIRFTKLYTFIK
jgi:hypothetical protein